MIEPVVKGLWLGFCIAAPVGPIGTLVLKKSLRWGFRTGVICGMGAALADLCYGLVASAGVRLTSAYSRPFAVVGGLLLLWLAWKSWQDAPAQEATNVAEQRWVRNMTTTFLLTLSNPMTILSFAALIASSGSEAPECFVAGIFAGSMLWWITLSAASSGLARFIEIRGFVLNRVAAITLAAFGIWAIYSKGIK